MGVCCVRGAVERLRVVLLLLEGQWGDPLSVVDRIEGNLRSPTTTRKKGCRLSSIVVRELLSSSSSVWLSIVWTLAPYESEKGDCVLAVGAPCFAI